MLLGLALVSLLSDADLLQKMQRFTRIQTLHLWTPEIILTELLDPVWCPLSQEWRRMLSHILFVGGSMKPCLKETMGTIGQEISQNYTVQHVNQTVIVVTLT